MKREEAIKYILSEKKGKLDDLLNNLTTEQIDGLLLTGLLRRGEECDKTKSWAVTKKAFDLYEEKSEKESFMQKIHNFINFKIMKETSTLNII